MLFFMYVKLYKLIRSLFSYLPNSSSFQLELMFMKTLCPQQMLVHKGGKIKNWSGECRDVTPTKSLSQNIRVRVGKMPAFMSKVHATGVYWHLLEKSGIFWHILAFPQNIS